MPKKVKEARRVLRKYRAITHYLRMIKWVREEWKHSKAPSFSKMEEAIEESWFCEYCAYCTEFYNDEYEECGDCPLGTLYHCCRGVWQQLNGASTRKAWLFYAHRVLRVIVRHG